MYTPPFFKGLSWLIVLNLLVKPVWIFFIDRQVQNFVGLEAYGRYFAVLNLSYVLFFLSDAGLSTMLNQRLAKGFPVNVRQLLRFKLLLLFCYATAVCLVAWVTQVSSWSVLFYVVAVQSLTSFFVFLRSIITARQYFSLDAWLSVLDKSLMILLAGSIIYTSFFGSISLLLFLKLQVISTGLAIAVCFIFLVRKRWITAAENEHFFSVIKKVFPFALVVLLMSVHYRIDGFLLERLHGNGAFEAGIYASAYRLLDAANMIGYLSASFFVAFVAKHLHEEEILQSAVLNLRHFLVIAAVGVVCFAVMFGPWIMDTLYHSATSEQVLVLQLCLAVFPAYCLVHVYGSVLTGAASLRGFIVILVWSVCVNIGLNLILIPKFGAIACCIAALVSQYFCGFFAMYSVNGKLSIDYGWRSWLAYAVIAVSLLLFFFLARVASINVWLVLVMAIAAGAVVLVMRFSLLKKFFISYR